jgi:hypothetical protein
VSTEQVRDPELLTIISPLGIRFRDVITGTFVDDGLSVIAYPENDPSSPIGAFANRKGVFVFRDLPGVQEIFRQSPAPDPSEHPTADEVFWIENAALRRMVVEVQDLRKRYHPFSLKVNAPCRGLFQWTFDIAESPLSREQWVPLFSTASRIAPAGMAVIRADLTDAMTGKPAAWALVEAIIGGSVRCRGLSGTDGQVVLILPYPEPRKASILSPMESPLSGDRTPLLSEGWQVTFSAYYSPLIPTPTKRDLDQIGGQSKATLFSQLSPPTELGAKTLNFGKELVLKSDTGSNLWITPLSPL